MSSSSSPSGTSSRSVTSSRTGTAPDYQEPVRNRFASAEADEVYQLLRQTYGPNQPIQLAAPQGEFAFGSDAVNVNPAAPLRVERMWNTAPMAAHAHPVEMFVAVMAREGGLQVSMGGDEIRLAAGDCLAYATDRPSRVAWQGGQITLVALPLAVVADVARLDDSASPASLFGQSRAAAPRLAHHWRRVTEHVEQELRTTHSALGHPLVAAETTRMLAATALTTFPNAPTTEDWFESGGASTPSTVRRAEEFIEANAHRPLTVAEIAAGASIGVRGLQQAFARHRHTTPMAHLRRVRLERAHRDLQLGHPSRGDTVRDIAGRWGFGRPDRFAALYRETYGTTPRETLRS
ncbi:AraC-like DNA-binding protein [Knoellia remsis]|uniref:AraC-like DNA-binding protein n=1 Tax=Knoellia remsis TaxID=407159 RepID=A0A2T0U6E2_9MICO|nr:AraC family transcriptional regulator [Knoellia remsis]PRY53481.1 AraC-like DNA-binding protein [Knoellia remsis]